MENNSPPVYEQFVGVDIAQATFVVALKQPEGEPETAFTCEQTPSGFEALHKRLEATHLPPAHRLIVMEATGSYWIPLALDLHQAGYAVSVINPAQAYHFAKALLQRSKTDALDAQTLAQLAQALKPPRWTPPPDVYYALQQRLAERDTLIEMRQQLKNQLHALQAGGKIISEVQQRKQALMETLTQQIEAVDAELKTVVEQDSAWKEAFTILQSITGIGLLTASWLLCSTLNFTACATPEAVSAVAGLAPIVRRSGTSLSNHAQIGHYGDSRLRTALYLATLSAAQHNPLIKAFYDRLRKAGKPIKVARCAAARKLLVLAFTLVKKGRLFDPDYAKPACT